MKNSGIATIAFYKVFSLPHYTFLSNVISTWFLLYFNSFLFIFMIICSKNLKVSHYHRGMSVPFYIDAEYDAKLNSKTYHYAENLFWQKLIPGRDILWKLRAVNYDFFIMTFDSTLPWITFIVKTSANSYCRLVCN